MPQDFLGKDCTLLDGVTLEDFKLQFCDRCLNSDCGRSIAGTSRFDKRIVSWEEDMFTEVPKMAPNDQRLSGIHAKRFVEIRTGPAPEVGQGAWVDPRDLDEPVETTHQYDKPALVEPALVEPPPVAETPEALPPAFVQPQVMNTPNRPSQMLKGTPRPVVDPWEPKGKPAGEGEIVSPGARIRFGD